MHNTAIREEIKDRLMVRRGHINFYEDMDPEKIALIVIDMQNTFCVEGGPAEVKNARGIIPNINKLSNELRAMSVPVIWVLHANTTNGDKSDWELFYNHVVSGDVRKRTLESNAPENQAVYDKLDTEPSDITIIKNRYSALTARSSSLERVLRSRGIDTVLIAGTKTNVCCESTARDAMMMDFKVTLLSDCCAALSDEEHLSAMENIIQQFGNVLSSDDALKMLRS